VDLRCRHKNHPDVFDGAPFEVAAPEDDRDDAILGAVRRFVEATGRRPNQDSWAAAGCRPSERTVRRRYGSFEAALSAAAIDMGPIAEPPPSS
jgi:hypothetical protein